MTAPCSAPPVTVIVPCLDEADGLPALLERLCAMHERPPVCAWHVLFVDDGSTDDSFATLLRAERDLGWVEVIRHRENLGLGAALRTGFAHTRSPIVCTMDSDCTYAPERLPELVRLVEAGADIATASAWHPDSVASEGARLRLLLSRSVSRLYQALVAQDVHTFTCLFRAYRREVLERVPVQSDGFGAVAELMLRAMCAGYRIAELPMALEPRRHGVSKLRTMQAVATHCRLLAMTAVMRSGSTRVRAPLGEEG
jgi:dolichol-phosphate mannosyltransferase